MSSAELAAHLDLLALVDELERRHRAPKGETADHLIGEAGARLLVRSATSAGALGTKLVSIVPGNLDRGIPSVQALMVVFNRADGAPLAVLDATEMTYWKTAADSALGSRLLSRPDSQCLLVCGAGGLAPWLVRGHLAVRPIARALIWNRTPARAAQAATALERELGLPVEAAGDLQRAVGQADIVCTATMAREPFLKGAWLRPGQHLDLVGSYGPDTREADDACIRRSRVFVDSRESALHGVGDILGAMRSGALRQDEILADLYDLAAGAAGRADANDITLFKNAGGCHLDLMTAEFLLGRIATAKGKPLSGSVS